MKITANIESYNGVFVAWIDNIKGLVVESDSLESVCREMLISLKIKLAHDLGIDVSDIHHQQVSSENEAKRFIESLELSEGKGRKDINLDMSFC